MANIQSAGFTQLGTAVNAVKNYISKSYIQQLSNNCCQVLEVKDPQRVKVGLRLLKISQLAISDELIESRLTSVYQTVRQLVNSAFMIIQGTPDGTSMYLGIQSDAPGTAETALIQTLTGNFPGIVLESLDSRGIEEVMSRVRSEGTGRMKTVSAISVVPSERDEKLCGDNVQGMEKFMDTMQGKSFTAMILASPYSPSAVNQRISALESIYTSLSSFERLSVQDTKSSSLTVSDSVAQGVSNSITDSINSAFSVGNVSANFNQSGNGRAFTISPLGLGISFQGQTGTGTSTSNTHTQTQGKTKASTVGQVSTLGKSTASQSGSAFTTVKTETNKEVQDLLQKIDRQIMRLRESEAQGIWDCCGYFVSNANDTAIVAANSFGGIVTGDSSDVEQSAMTLWQPTGQGDINSNHNSIINLTNSLSLGVAPVFFMGTTAQRTESIVTGKELSRMLSFPRKSAGNVSVVRMASFGRKVHFIGGKEPEGYFKDGLEVGNVLHMGKEDEGSPVRIDLQTLNAHAFATGATGVGKTTAICKILHELYKKGVPFTVIEPAKGEYGELWGKLPGIEIYSTLPFRYRMLRINPFSFGDNVHILDHMERLISVFSTAWPLYAAQPAILRDCVRRAYISCGWDMCNSICLRPQKQFPTFKDVLRVLPEVIENSKFVGEAKGTYEGALRTRISMLTEGVLGEIFCSDGDISGSELFDKTVIVDLSRLGGGESLSLVMGLLLIKLYEHRLGKGKTEGLNHVTVLEEAHNILKKAPSAPVGEDVSTIGAKSVEVLTRCITELRFTGEGFIIADQSPEEVDVTAIKNTSTKIAMRLQNSADKESMGSAMALDNGQKGELSRLGRGAAVVLQEGWNEPVLTQFTKFVSPFSTRGDDAYASEVSIGDIRIVRGYLLKIILNQFRLEVFDLREYKEALGRVGGFSKWKLRDYRAMFERYDALMGKSGAFSQGSRQWISAYGKIIRELLDCSSLFSIFPLPLPTRDMSAPYSQDPKFIDQCKKWRDNVSAALDYYCEPIKEDDKKDIIKLLLLQDGPECANKIRVQASLSGIKEVS